MWQKCDCVGVGLRRGERNCGRWVRYRIVTFSCCQRARLNIKLTGTAAYMLLNGKCTPSWPKALYMHSCWVVYSDGDAEWYLHYSLSKLHCLWRFVRCLKKSYVIEPRAPCLCQTEQKNFWHSSTVDCSHDQWMLPAIVTGLDINWKIH